MSSQVCWRAIHYRSLLVEEWEDGFTVFQPDSGKTHFLNPVAMRILQTLHAAPDGNLAEDAIVADLLSWFETGSSPDVLAEVEMTLSHLDELGLIEWLAEGSRRDP